MVVVLVQHLQRLQQLMRLDEHREVFKRAWCWADAFLQCEYGRESDMYRMLQQTLLARGAAAQAGSADAQATWMRALRCRCLGRKGYGEQT